MNLTSKAIESLWLAIAFAVPLLQMPSGWMVSYVQLPKVAFLRIAIALIAALWAIEWSVTSANSGGTPESSRTGLIRRLTTVSKGNPVVAAGIAFAVVYLLAAALSSIPRDSLIGGPSSIDNFSLLSIASYFVLFIAIALRVRTQGQIVRLLTMVAASATIAASIGILEYLDVLPLGTDLGRRVHSTFGNPIFFGAFLAMSIPLTLGLFAARELQSRAWLARVVAGIALGLQLLALILTVSRGPWIGCAVGLLLLLAHFAFLGRRSQLFGAVALTGIALAIAISVSFALPEPPVRVTDEPSASAGERISGALDPVSDPGLSSRVAIWRGSLELYTATPWFPEEPPPVPVRTWLFGYGPDTFSTVFPLAASERTRLPSQAHNHLLQLLVEVGALGLLAHLVLVGIALFTGARFLWRERNSYSESAARSIVVAAILAAIVAWSVEQLVGVPRVSDLVLFWLLLGALAAVASGRGLQPDADARYARIQKARIRSAASLVFAMAATAACIWWIYAWDVSSVRADILASQAVMSQDPDAAYVLADRAMELSRGQASYRQIAGDVREKKLRTLTDLQARALVAEELYVIRYLAWQQHPFSGLARIGLADGALELARLGYPGKADEAIGIYRNVIETTRQQRPLHRQIEMSIAVAYIESGRSHEAAGILAVLLTDEALATGSRMNALYLQGAALFELGEQTNAALSLEQALQMDYDQDTEAASHSLLSKVYSAMGETSLAERHAQLHAELVAAR